MFANCFFVNNLALFVSYPVEDSEARNLQGAINDVNTEATRRDFTFLPAYHLQPSSLSQKQSIFCLTLLWRL